METLADLTFLKSFTGGDPEKMKKYIGLFLSGADPSIKSINSCLASSDWSALRTAAHSLKSQVKYMGIKSAEELAFHIEQHAGNQTSLDTLPSAVKDLESVVTRSCDELRAFLQTL